MEPIERPYDAAAASRSGWASSEFLAHLDGMVERRLLRRVAAILYHRRAGFSANGMGVWRVPEEEIIETGLRMASFRGISHCYQRPTYPDWPYSVFTMAHGRSKEECDAILDSIAEECGIGEQDRATLYSSTEYKKIRLRYFTDEYRQWEEEHLAGGAGSAQMRALRAVRALQVLPGGVNSPVRAMRQIGREPIFIERGEGCELIDVDGNRYIDWVCSWGPLILGHAEPGVVAAVPRRRDPGDQLRRRHRGGGGAGRGGLPQGRLGRDGPHDQLRHRGGDERGAAGPRGHRPRDGGQVRRRLPRSLRRPARRGGLGDGDARGAGEPRGHRRPGRGHGGRSLERPRGGRQSALDEHRGRRPARRADRRQHGRGPARPRASSPSCARRPPRPGRCSSSTR